MTQQFMKKAIFQFCTNSECTFSEDLHLLVTQHIVDIKRDNAVAISYTWGEFNRRAVVIGHMEDDTSVSLCLGEEWNPSDFAARLQDICLESSGCWIDQICIPQKDEEIRATLAAIPDIYRTLDVITLLSSAPCKCFSEAAAVADKDAGTLNLARSSRTEAEHRATDQQMMSAWGAITAKCFNIFPCTSWFTRLWTRARVPVLFEDSCRICDKRASSLFPGGPPERKNCSLLQDDRDLHRLQPYLALTFKKSLESGGSRSSAIRAIGNSITTTSVPGIQAVSDYTNTLGQMSAASNLCRFFSGTKLERAQQLGSDGDVRAKVHTFMEQLVRLGAARRVATQERDYVVAVWVDCPGYVLPSNYKAMGLPALLDNAVWQLENNFRASPIVTAPTGIFGGCLESSGLWRPSRYIQRLSVKSTGTVYGVLSTQSVIAPSGKGFQLDRWIVGTTALSRVAQPYQQMFGSRSTATALEAMASIAINWTSDSSQGQALKWAMNFNRQSVDAVTEGPEDVFRMSLIGCMDSGKVGVEWLGENIDHHSVLYRMVTDMLGLDYDLCQSEGLVLMGSPQASCIGLLRAAVIESAQNNVTVLMSAVASGCLAFEAEQVQVRPALPVPAYRVCGVWVPTKHCRF